jgi:DNA-binding MarR family transcriptional regulator
VDALVDKGFVERRPDPEDRRRIHLQLTPAGAEIGGRVHECLSSTLADYLAPLSDDQIEDIRRALSHLRSLVPDAGDCPKTEG